MKPNITFSQAGKDWLRGLPADIRENGRTLSENTLKVYAASVARASAIVGDLPLERINNEIIRDLIAKMRAQRYSASTIRGDLTVVKLVVESLTENGEPIFALRINKKFARVPRIIPSEQNAPCATRANVEKALRHPELACPVAIAAGAGLRVAEILALHVGDCPSFNSWDSENAVIHVRAGKTPSAKRAVPIPRELNEFLQSVAGDKTRGDALVSISQNHLYNLLEARGLPLMHSYRRFFTTVRDQTGMNVGALKRVLGHSKGSDVTARYSRAADDAAFLRAEMDRCALGFSFPVAPERQEAIAAVSA